MINESPCIEIDSEIHMKSNQVLHSEGICVRDVGVVQLVGAGGDSHLDTRHQWQFYLMNYIHMSVGTKICGALNPSPQVSFNCSVYDLWYDVQCWWWWWWWWWWKVTAHSPQPCGWQGSSATLSPSWAVTVFTSQSDTLRSYIQHLSVFIPDTPSRVSPHNMPDVSTRALNSCQSGC